jgi:hypothetical protein
MKGHALRVLAAAVAGLLLAGAAAAQVRPAAIGTVRPTGAQRGTTATLTIEGYNLADASAVLFDHAGLTGRIVKNEDLGADVIERDSEATGAPIEDRARDSRLTLEVTLSPDVPLGRHPFRIVTPLGTTNVATLTVGRLAETVEAEPAEPAGAQELALPLTVNGVVEKDDVDRYRFTAKAGQQMVFEVVAAGAGSSLDPVLTLFDAHGAQIVRVDDFRGRPDAVLVHRFKEEGAYSVQVADAAGGGGPGYFYRLTAGELPYVTDVFPLGVRAGTPATVRVEGINLPAATLTLDGSGRSYDDRLYPAVDSPLGAPLNRVMLAVGDHPEQTEREPNDRLRAQPITFPVTVNGRIEGTKGGAKGDDDVFRFRAAKGQKVVFTVNAERLGSRLDSLLEVLDAAGRSVPRAVLRPVWQTSVDLRDHESTGGGVRLLSWAGLQTGDHVYIDRELIRLRELPGHPDADALFVNFRGRRVAFEDTTSEGHAYNTPVYKVEVLPPGATPPSNGMPLFTLDYRNDDGGYTFGRDSRLTFTAPAAGEYLLRLRDRRGLSGPEFAYRLTAAEPRPDFKVFVGTTAPNVPRGGRVPVYVAVERTDGYEGPVEVEATGLPPGLTATTATVPPGATSAALTLAASTEAPATPVRFKLVARARIGEQTVEHEAMMDGPPELSVATAVGPPELHLAAVEPAVIELPAGGRAKVTLQIRRAGGFAGRVPVGVQNVPPGVHIPDIGLNGVLITEKQDAREFYLEADPHAPPIEQRLFLTGRVEVNSSLPSEQASETVLLKVVPRRTAAKE